MGIAKHNYDDYTIMPYIIFVKSKVIYIYFKQ